MTIAQALYEFMLEQPPVVAIVADRLFPVELPQPRQESAPGDEIWDLQDSLVFRMTGMDAEDGLSQTGVLAETWELLCLSSDHARAHNLKDAVLSALRGYTGPMPASGGVENAAVQFTAGRDEYDQEFAIYGVVLTFSITP
jgi:hypothetical protein